MSIYVLNTILTIVWESIFLRGINRKNRKAFIFIVSIQMILLSGLRHVSIGADTWNYEGHFYEVINPSLDQYYGWKPLLLKLIRFHSQTYSSRDIGYELFTKLFATFIPNFRVFLFAVAIFVCVGLARFLDKYSSDIAISYVLFQTFILPFMLLTGIRQTIAMGLVVFWGYDFIKSKRLMRYFVLCFVAALFHFTALVMLPFYFICNYPRQIKYKYFISIVISIFIIVFNRNLFRFLPIGLYSFYAESASGQGIKFIFFMFVVILWMAILRSKRSSSRLFGEDTINFEYGTILAELFVVSSLIVGIFFRLGYYYLLYMICYFPILIRCFGKKINLLIKYMLYAFALIYILTKGGSYAFYF
ncbi:EpsG family protein [Oribacterium sinus]|uniref:EpsG family protein n=1 Tax=Oribacterium sinus TaxID=237576 RepID=UPI0028D8E66A|nr:EpsG family protein [Oribacterium sinus]